MTRTPIQTPHLGEQWTPETVRLMIALTGEHSTSNDGGTSYPVLYWYDTGDNHAVHLCAYQEPSDGIWQWVVEADQGCGTDRRAVRLRGQRITFTTTDQNEALAVIAETLNQFAVR